MSSLLLIFSLRAQNYTIFLTPPNSLRVFSNQFALLSPNGKVSKLVIIYQS